jgi:hypothetical protein
MKSYYYPDLLFKKKWVWFSKPKNISGVDMVTFFSYDSVEMQGFKKKEGLTSVIDLRKDIDEIWNKMRAKFIRKQIRRAERNNKVIKKNISFSQFKKIYKNFRKQKGIQKDKVSVFKNSDLLLGAYFEGKLVSVGNFAADENSMRAWVLASIRLKKKHKDLREVIGQANRLIIWQDSDLAEIGSHMHPWTTPPISDLDKIQRFPSELDKNEFDQKLKKLTEVIEKNIGKPTSFRSGKWGFKKEMVSTLTNYGYIIDSSITPKIDWSSVIKKREKHREIPNFKKESIHPYLLNHNLVELPLTVLYTGLFSKENIITNCFSNLNDSSFKKLINKLFFKLLQPRILLETTIKNFKKLYSSAQRNQLPVFQFMIHSSELCLGTSPYSKTEKEVNHIFDVIDKLFQFIQKEGLESVFLSQYAKIYLNEQPQNGYRTRGNQRIL